MHETGSRLQQDAGPRITRRWIDFLTATCAPLCTRLFLCSRWLVDFVDVPLLAPVAARGVFRRRWLPDCLLIGRRWLSPMPGGLSSGQDGCGGYRSSVGVLYK